MIAALIARPDSLVQKLDVVRRTDAHLSIGAARLPPLAVNVVHLQNLVLDKRNLVDVVGTGVVAVQGARLVAERQHRHGKVGVGRVGAVGVVHGVGHAGRVAGAHGPGVLHVGVGKVLQAVQLRQRHVARLAVGELAVARVADAKALQAAGAPGHGKLVVVVLFRGELLRVRRLHGKRVDELVAGRLRVAAKVDDPQEVQHGQQDAPGGAAQVAQVGAVDEVVGGVGGVQKAHQQEPDQRELVQLDGVVQVQ